ncbi:hypothetical protein DSUL_50394 [Desulfovibrionales bacterium]
MLPECSLRLQAKSLSEEGQKKQKIKRLVKMIKLDCQKKQKTRGNGYIPGTHQTIIVRTYFAWINKITVRR